MNTSWLEISKKNIIHNIKSIKSLLGKGTVFMAITKANGYGHGMVEVSAVAIENGADMLGVASFGEAEILRKNKVRSPILILGYVPLNDLQKAVKLNCQLTVYNKEVVEKLGSFATGKTIQVHIKVETGLNRHGVDTNDLPEFLQLVSKYSNIEIVGLSSHFANVEDTTNHKFAGEQLKNFQEAIEICAKHKIFPKMKHICATAASMIFQEACFDTIRVGIGIYGLWPSPETRESIKKHEAKIELKPTMTWKTIVAQIKDAKRGDSIGYGCAEIMKKDSKIAVLPIGYWDGYSRLLSRKGEVLVGGKRCKILGRICMNVSIIDITNISNVNLEDEVVLLGKQGDEEITAEEMAEKSDTINYEVVTRINPLLPRIYV